MATKNDSLRNAVPETAARIGEDVTARAAQFKDRVSDVARTAADAADDRRSMAADRIDTAASALRDNAGSLPGGDRMARAAHATADGLETTADYVRSRDLGGMMSDMQSLVKRNPALTLAAAAAVGFIVGRATRND